MLSMPATEWDKNEEGNAIRPNIITILIFWGGASGQASRIFRPSHSGISKNTRNHFQPIQAGYHLSRNYYGINSFSISEM